MNQTSPWPAVVRAAAKQARITLVRTYTSASGISTVVMAAVMLAVLWFLRNAEFGQDDLVAAGGYVLTGFLAFGVIAAAVIGVAAVLQAEREDGTLLRAKAVPHGMTGHLLAKLFVAPIDALVPLVPLVVGAALLLPGAMPTDPGRWAWFVVVFLLTVAAMLPWGAVLGSLFRTMMGLAWTMMGIYLIAAVSGVFFPVTAMPTWLQWVAQLNPLYWIGLAFRAVLLPAEAAALEIGGDFRTGLTLAVLVGWAVVGFVLAPILLRRMARRQSGSTVAAARERVLNKGY